MARPRPRCPDVPLCRYADPLIKDLRRLVPQALDAWDEAAIHKSRVATRRLRAAIDLLEPVVAQKTTAPLRKTLRRLRRRLGPLRDLDVMIGHLQPLIEKGRHRRAAAWLSQRLQHERADVRRATQKKSPPQQWLDRLDAWQPVRSEVIALGGDVDALMLESLASQWTAFAGQAERLTRQMLVDMVDGGGDGDARDADVQDPHELRIAGKQLRYTFEMLADSGQKLPAVTARTFKRMQAELGLWHDGVVLTEWAMRQSIAGLLAHHDPELQSQVLAMATATLRGAERHLRRFATLWRERGETIGQIVEQLTGDAGSGRNRRRSPKPHAPPQPPAPGETSAA